MRNYKKIYQLFLKSAITEENKYISTTDAITWIKERNNANNVEVEKVPFNELKQWEIDKKTGKIAHESGKFFSIEGIHVETNWGKVSEWEQPIINQPEVGYLGIITKEFNGILYFLLQAKVEPGNVNNVQLSPTLQATRSNYSQVHKGKKPKYLEYFRNAQKKQILLDQLQSEQGARFLQKRNRNMIIKVEESIELEDDFIWLTLGQIKKLISYDNLVNMDTRTVISGIPFGEYTDKVKRILEQHSNRLNQQMLSSSMNTDVYMYSFDEIIMWLTNLKCTYDLNVTRKSLFDINDWVMDDMSIHHRDGKYFKVIATKVEISNREVTSWYQPLIEPVEEGIIAFVFKKFNDVPHFLVQAKLECGNFDILELAPTVQCITGSYKNSKEVPYLDYVLQANESQIKHDSLQSEEGGRFYKEQNRNMIIEADDNFNIQLPDNFIWVTLNQLNSFLKFNNYLNIQARSLLSTINFIK